MHAVESVCEFLPRMKVRHPLQTYLRLRCVSWTVLQATHVPMNAACSHMIIRLGEQIKQRVNESFELGAQGTALKRLCLHQPLETYRQQYTALKKVIDSGFLFQTLQQGTDSTRDQRD